VRQFEKVARAAAAAFGAEMRRCAEVVAAIGALATLQVPKTLALWQLCRQEQHTGNQLDDANKQECSNES
jgi:hypothetical protein